MKDHESNQMSRRKFLAYLGSSATAIAVASTGLGPLIGKAEAAAAAHTGATASLPDAMPFTSLKPAGASHLTVPSGYAASAVTGQGPAGSGYIGFFAGSSQDEGLLWISHSAGSDTAGGIAGWKTRGASVIGVRKQLRGEWAADASIAGARRITGLDRVTLTGPARGTKALSGATAAQGLWCNGSGGSTPWGTVLAGEQTQDRDTVLAGLNPQTVGWIGEADPRNAQFAVRKHTALGRFSHGDTAVALTKNNRVAVYMGGEYALYKYVSRGKFDPAKGNGNSALLEDGILYAADLTGGRWIELSLRSVSDTLSDPAYRVPEGVHWLREELLELFKDQADVVTYAHEAALLLGATVLEHGRGIALHPSDQSLFIAQRGNDGSGNSHGNIMRLVETDGDAGALTLECDLIVAGGRQSALSSPAAIAFDRSGRLWAASYIKPARLHQGTYASFGNNGLSVLVPAGTGFAPAQTFAIAPGDAVLSAPAFGADDTVFTSVKHPQGSDKDGAIAAISKL